MRPLEISLLLITLVAVVAGMPWVSRARRWSTWFSFPPAIILIAQISFEGCRWQLIPIYAVALWLLLSSLLKLLRAPRAENGSISDRLYRVAGHGLKFVLLGLGGLLSFVLPVFKFPAPTGPYSVGTVSLHLVDKTRREPFSKNPGDAREMMIQVWYPAESSSNHEYLRYTACFLGKKTAREIYGSRFAQLDLVETHSIPEAPFAKAQLRWPVLIFSPAWSGSLNQNTFEAEELASHGYVVVGMDHPHCTGVTVFPDGRAVTADPSLDLDVSSDAAIQDYIRKATEQVHIRSQDAVFVLNELKRLNSDDRDGRFSNKLDLEKVGIFGHSFGGTVAAQTCLMDKRFKAGLNMDGMLFGDICDEGVSQPFLFMNSDETRPTPEQIAHSSYARLDDRGYKMQDAYLARNGGYDLTIKKASHLNYCDTAQFSPFRRLTGAGKINAHRCMRIVNDYTLAFFEKYLKNSPATLLDSPSSENPEVVMKKYNKSKQ
jgi:dienelactone hydrolase